MSDSDVRKELVGIARSIDALFGAHGIMDPPLAAPTRAAPELDADRESESVPSSVAVEAEAHVDAELLSPWDEPDADDAAESEPSDLAAEIEPTDLAAEIESSDLAAAVEAYLAGSTARAADVRSAAAERIAAKDYEPVADALARLAEAAGEPADEAILAVARDLASQVVLGVLARRIGAERDESRRRVHHRVCRALGEDMARAIRDHLGESTDRLARKIHCETLVEMGAAGRVVIEEMARDENRFLVRNAVAILGEVGGEGAVELVTGALANPDARVRREALRSLAKLGDEESGQLVVGMLDDPDPAVRLAAAVAAGELHVERAVKPLIAALDASDDPDEWIALVRALGQLGDPGAVSSIEKRAVPTLFSRPRTDVRIAAYRALAQIGTPHARRLLNQAVSDKDPEVKAAVRGILHMR